MDQHPPPPYNTAMNIGTRLHTFLHGERVGSDDAGNVYYQDRKIRPGEKRRRWVAFKGPPEASAVPPEWHAWLHYTVDAPLAASGRKPWQKPHLANATGSATSYRPPGHAGPAGQRAHAAGDYESWTPGA